MMTTKTDSDFWLNEADPNVDICDSRLTPFDFLQHITPEVPKGIKNPKVLEIGCGIGRLTNELQYQFPHVDVIGTDINQNFLDIAKNNTKQKEVQYFCTDTLEQFNDIDFIYSVLVFQHLNNEAKQEYIRQVSKALKNSGVFLFQYVEGKHSSRAMYDAELPNIYQWCKEVGLIINLVNTNQVCERWTWVRAVKK